MAENTEREASGDVDVSFGLPSNVDANGQVQESGNRGGSRTNSLDPPFTVWGLWKPRWASRCGPWLDIPDHLKCNP
jgi:hypothetical protein